MEKGTKFLLDKGRLIDNGIIFLMYYQHEVWQGPITKAAKLRRYLGEAYRVEIIRRRVCLLACLTLVYLGVSGRQPRSGFGSPR